MNRSSLSYKSIILTIVLLISPAFVLIAGPYPESEIQDIYSSGAYSRFFGTIYNASPLHEIETQLSSLKNWISESDYSSTSQYISVVRAEMIYAKHLILEDYCKDLYKAEEVLRQGLSVLSQIPETDRDIEFLLVEGELNGSYYLLDQGKYLFSYGVKSNNLTKKIWDLNKENPRSIILKCNQLIYTPPLFGGSIKKARALLKGIVDEPLLAVDEYTVYSCLGFIEAKLKHKETAFSYYQKALKIYPHNLYIQSLIAEL